LTRTSDVPRPEPADIVVLTALGFESRVANALGLKRVGRAGLKTFAGRVGVRMVELVQVGVKARRLGELSLPRRAGLRSAVISLGLAGGLSPGLSPGSIVVPQAVLWRGKRFESDPDLLALLTASGALPIRLLGCSDEILFDAEAKRTFRERTGAGAVDMESGPIAEWALENSLPFAALKGISDPSQASIPRAIAKPKSLLPIFRALPSFALLAARSLKARRRLARVLRSAVRNFP